MEKRNDFSVFELKETCGRGAAGNYNGNAVLYTPAAGGIYQIEVLVAADCGGDVRYYVWDEDEDREIGFAAKGDMKAFGVCDEQWQIDLRNCAKSYLRSTAYLSGKYLAAQYGFPEYPAGDFSFKCNIFVAHRAVEAGLVMPKTRGLLNRYPPLANDWANEAYVINSWPIRRGYPEPGFVVAKPSAGMGHVGIMDFDYRFFEFSNCLANPCAKRAIGRKNAAHLTSKLRTDRKIKKWDKGGVEGRLRETE